MKDLYIATQDYKEFKPGDTVTFDHESLSGVYINYNQVVGMYQIEREGYRHVLTRHSLIIPKDEFKKNFKLYVRD